MYICGVAIGVPGFEKCVEDSTFEELAIENAKIISAIVEGLNTLENQSALETVMYFDYIPISLTFQCTCSVTEKFEGFFEKFEGILKIELLCPFGHIEINNMFSCFG
jgi:hypothetical protein